MIESVNYFFSQLDVRSFFDLFLVWLIIYQALLLAKNAGATQIITGLIVFSVLYLGSRYMELITFGTILEKLFSHAILIVVILFQGEIRKALAQLGSNPFVRKTLLLEETQLADEIIKSSFSLAQRGCGALIVIEGEITLDYFIEKGVEIDAKVNTELLISIFHPKSPLHDGAVVIRGRRIFSAGCFLPLSKNPIIDKNLGTRHRAAIGLTEETDAKVFIISEETKSVSLASEGQLEPDLDLASLRTKVFSIFGVKET